ncbi:MAG: MFS transporter [Defluviitaleaceae bacterium]|nr:MFS transporter [Defluviitaleaceae bacterium]
MFTLFKENRMFRVLLAYQVFSGLGGAIFGIFMLLSVHLIYENPIYTGIAGFLMTAPHIFSFMVGPVVDKGNKVLIMRLTTFLEFAVVGLLAFVPFQEYFGVWFMFSVIAIYSIAALFEGPAGLALLPQIVHEDKNMDAISAINIAALVGGLGVAILLFSLIGDIGNLSLIFGISSGFLAVAIFISLFLKDPNARQAKEKRSLKIYLNDLKEAGNFVRKTVLLYITVFVVAKAFAIEVASINMPEFAYNHAGAQGYILLAIMGVVGGIFASSLVSAVGKKVRVGWLIFTLFVLAGAVRVVFVLLLPAHFIGGLGVLIVYTALGGMLNMVHLSLRQRIPKKDMVGRVQTISTTVAAIFVAIGSLVGGFLGSIIPVVDHIFIYQGIAYAVIGFVVILVPSVRKLPTINEMKKDEDEELEVRS